MLALRWIFGAIASLVAGWILTLNWIIFWEGWVQKKGTSSIIPLIGAIVGAGALLLLPVPFFHYLWWFPFVVDWGSLPAIVIAIKRYKRPANKL